MIYIKQGAPILERCSEIGALSSSAASEGDEPAAPVAGRRLRCKLDGERTHERCAGICYLEGRDIAETLVRAGLARDCRRFSGGRYAEAERRAVAAGAAIRQVYQLPGYCRE